MQAANMDMYLVPVEGFHQSEYVGTYFKVRAWLSDFPVPQNTAFCDKR